MVQITRVGQTSIWGSVMIVFDFLEGLGVELGVSSVKEGQCNLALLLARSLGRGFTARLFARSIAVFT